jgi:hypothetical protein
MIRSTLVAALLALLARADGRPELLEKLQPHLAVLGLRTGQDSIDDALRRLGKTEIVHNGLDAAGSARCACFIGADGTVLGLCSSGEGNGTGLKITTLQLATSSGSLSFSPQGPGGDARAIKPRCGRTASLSRAVATAGGLRLGSTDLDIQRALGAPTGRGPTFLEYGALPASGSGYSRVVFQLSAGQVTGISTYVDPL